MIASSLNSQHRYTSDERMIDLIEFSNFFSKMQTNTNEFAFVNLITP